MNNILITIKKELRTIFRDKKSLSMMFIAPLFIALFIIFYGYMHDLSSEDNKEYYVGINYQMTEAEKEVFNTDEFNIKQYDNFEDMEKAYDDKEIDCYVTYDESEHKYYVYYNQNADMNTQNSAYAGSLFISTLNAYNDLITNTKLLNDGIDINTYSNNFTIEDVNIAEDNTDIFVKLTLSMGVSYLIMAICMAASNIGISTTATENENGTLETLLTVPMSRKELIIGKYLSCFIVSFIAGLFSLLVILCSVRLDMSLFSMFDDFNLKITFSSILNSILVITSAALFISGVSIALTAFASTFKEAQSKSNLLSYVTLVPFFISFMGISIDTFYYLIPICNVTQLLNDILLGHFEVCNTLITFGSTIVYSIIVIMYIIKTYNSEKILFNS